MHSHSKTIMEVTLFGCIKRKTDCLSTIKTTFEKNNYNQAAHLLFMRVLSLLSCKIVSKTINRELDTVPTIRISYRILYQTCRILYDVRKDSTSCRKKSGALSLFPLILTSKMTHGVCQCTRSWIDFEAYLRKKTSKERNFTDKHLVILCLHFVWLEWCYCLSLVSNLRFSLLSPPPSLHLIPRFDVYIFFWGYVFEAHQ